jgi:hypothetical protein
MTRRRRALLIGTALLLCGVSFAALHRDVGLDDALVPVPNGPRATTATVGRPSARHTAPTTSTSLDPAAAASTTPAPATGGPPPAGGAAPTTAPGPAPTVPPTTTAADRTPLLLAIAASAPAEPARPSGGQAVSRQRFVTIDAKATVDQLMGSRVEPIANGYRREGKPVQVLLFDAQPVHLEPVAPYVRETTTPVPATSGASVAPTTYSWMGTGSVAGSTVTASLSVSDDAKGTYRLVGTISTSSKVPPLLIDWVEADRYALTEIDPNGPCLPDVATPTSTTTAPPSDPSSPPTTGVDCTG